MIVHSTDDNIMLHKINSLRHYVLKIDLQLIPYGCL